MYPRLPDENVAAIREYLLGTERLNNLARAFGITAIVRYGEVRVCTYLYREAGLLPAARFFRLHSIVASFRAYIR
jgi:dsRNA-specific ribonuclease